LKQLYRQGWLHKNIPEERCESVAEHSFGVAVLGMLLAEAYYPDLDLLKILRMSLIHDFGEVYAGDFIPGDGISLEHKHQLEKESIIQIFSQIKNREDYLYLWEEFEGGVSPEAQFVRQIDKLEMALQASAYEHQGFGDLLDFYKSASKAISDPELSAILDELQLLR
jgi:putative hydrolase of HD superfamily